MKEVYHSVFDNHIVRIALATSFILLIPFVAMQFTDEVVWDAMDFVTIGALLFGTGLLYELLAGKVRKTSHRMMLGIGLVIILLLVWVELAVGIFD